MVEIAGLLVRLEATTSLLRKELLDAERQVDRTAAKITKDVNRIDDAVSRLGAGMAAALKGGLAGLAAGLTVGAVSQVVGHVTNLAAELDKASKASGISVENFQRFDAAMRASGLGVGQFQDAITELMPNLGEAIADRAGSASDAFEKMGISLRDASGNVRSTDKILLDVADALQKVPSAAEKAAIASALFGEEAGPKMAVALGQGSAAIDKLMADASVLSDDMVQKALDVQREWANIGAILQTELGGALLEILPTAETIRDAIIAISDEIESWQKPENRSVGYLRRELEGKKLQAAALRVNITPDSEGVAWSEIDRGELAGLEAEIGALEARIAVLDREAADRRAARNAERGDRGAAHTSKPTSTAKTDEERAAEKRAKFIADLRHETEQIGLNSDQIELNNALREAGTTINTAEGQEIARLIAIKQQAKREEELWSDAREKGNELQAERNRLLEASRTPLETYTREVERLVLLLESGDIDEGLFRRGVLIASEQMTEAQEKARAVSDEVKFLQDTGARAFDRIGRGITEAFASGENAAVSFKSVGLAVVSELMQAFIELAAINPIKNALLGTAEATLAGVAAGATGYFTGSPTITRTGSAKLSGDIYKVPDLLPKRAAGGPVAAGRPYVVGEVRPELFVPTVSGNIKPYLPSMSGAGAARSAAPATNVTQHLNFALGVSSTVRAEVANMMPQIANASRAAMLEAQARRGRSL
jgi:hypothetical protein